jgi:hypothetical protein
MDWIDGIVCLLLRFHDRGADEFVEFWKLAIKIRIATLKHLVLMARAHAAAGVFSVATVELFYDVHAFNDLTERSEAGFDVVAGGVVAQVDIDLRGTGVGAGVGEGDVAASVVLFEGVVGDGVRALLLRDFRGASYAELHPAARNDAEEARVVVVLRANEIVEAVCSVWGPVAVGFDDEAAGRGLKLYTEDGGRFGVAKRESQNKAEQVSHAIQSIFPGLSSCAIFDVLSEFLMALRYSRKINY